MYTAQELCAYRNADKLTAVYASSDIEVYPFQVAAAMFALRSPYLRGVVLADEGSLGKTYEALLVISQMWFEGKERVLVVVPTPLLGQWVEIMDGNFTVPYTVIDSNERFAEVGGDNPFEQQEIILTTYDFAIQKADDINRVVWNMVVLDEAHRISNCESKTATTLKEAVGDAFKLLLTATPMQNSIMDLYGLLHFIDEAVLGDAEEFYKRYFRKPENYHELTNRISRHVFRTLRSQVENYVKIPQRLPVTADYKLTSDEIKLSAMLAEYLRKPEKLAFPKMDDWELSLMMWRSFASSTFAFDRLLQGAIEREPEAELVAMQKLSANLNSNAKGQELLKVLKKAFAELKKRGANRKALIFTESRATQQYLSKLLRTSDYNVLTYNGDKSRNYDVMKKFEQEADVLISTDIAAEGFDLEFCSFIVNYDLPYNILTLEQRIMRCHRQGQQNDVVVLNFLNKQNLADTRMLELINKRVTQFDGIIGMSDDVVGNFAESAVDGVVAAFVKARHVKDIEAEFQSALVAHEDSNIAAVQEAENALFTTFTQDIAKKVTITPHKDRTDEINTKLWALTKWFFTGKQGYECIDETRTVKIGFSPQKVFTGSSVRRREYSIDDTTLPKSGRHTIAGTLAKNIISEILWRGIPDSGSINVDGMAGSCKIGYYRIKVKPGDVYWGGAIYNVFVGTTANGKLLSDEDCQRFMDLPVESFTAESIIYGERDGISKPKREHELDKLVEIVPFINRALSDTDDARREEVAAIQDRTYHQKQVLTRSIAVLKNQLLQIDNTLARSSDISAKMDAEKKRASASRDLKKREQSLFMDGMRVDVESEEAVKRLMEQANMKVDVYRYFAIGVEGDKCAQG